MRNLPQHHLALFAAAVSNRNRMLAIVILPSQKLPVFPNLDGFLYRCSPGDLPLRENGNIFQQMLIPSAAAATSAIEPLPLFL